MEVHSERESYRKVIELRTPEGQLAKVIITRRAGSGWLTFNGSIKTTVMLGGPQGLELIEALTTARNPT